ncbi:hypothetical protein [uncultured Sulfitobacter sp.]|uniref:hypothetical protein n=1 Tax=uncultured Sulfitobacter sp. TaxID=191468 RepID=UPI0025974F7D|nr:hypothetical protein [uncultured Sulfitobacter sp.]
MLAKRRPLKIDGVPIKKTPILLPSFSSKGFPKVAEILKTMEEFISDEILVSAYDIHYKKIKGPFDFAEVVFLDSGGYEASKDHELSEIYEGDYGPSDWTPEYHSKVIDGWDCMSPTVFVSYDGKGSERVPIAEQIARAKALTVPKNNSAKALLLKPETEDARRLNVCEILKHIQIMDGFAVIGVTEKEVGNSTLDRMVNIARIRKELDQYHKDIPIHVFGSLDTISTYLYFLAGADIFDGLTWLRYAFHDGDTIYRHNFGTLTQPPNLNSDIVEGRSWSHNYQYMRQMQLNMGKFIMDESFAHFGKHHEILKSCYDSTLAEL